ncbi:FAD-dependent oxidoreductase [bacterium]|nr:FAD-dependent oxidoreductase [bacterium]
MLPRLIVGLVALSISTGPVAIAATQTDVCVYGGTAGGVAAAIQVARMGKSVVLIEPTGRLGGLTTGGLGQTDIGNKMVIGGIAREFYRGIRNYYADPSHWKWQAPANYRSGGQSWTDSKEDTMWTFEPSAALAVLSEMLNREHVQVVYHERLDLQHGVIKSDGPSPRIVAIRMESGREFRSRMFIDASYEGDLMAKAGVSYIVGREANSTYGETYDGVQTTEATKHQLFKGIDPYVKPGDPTSGLLPGIDPTGPGLEGAADRRVQTYCFRMCLTDQPANRQPWTKPDGYRELDYELLFRNFEAGFNQVPWNNSAMPNHKTDINNNTGFSTDYIGMNYECPDGDYATRERIVADHLRYQKGLMWTLANNTRVPEAVRKEVSKWGPTKDEFTETGGWPEQLYIREARRMIGEVVMTQDNCQGRKVATDSIGMAAYTMDSHNVQRYVDANGHVRNEGDVEIGGFPPYPISYHALTPKRTECANLLVPLCLSASHIAFGSIRMEPVFMVLGQSAATAAVLAIDESVPVQDVDYPKLRARLLADRQVLEYESPTAVKGVPAKSLAGVVIDDDDARVKRQGFATRSSSIPKFVNAGYRTDDNQAKGEQSIRYEFTAPATGRFELRLAYSAYPNRATNVPVTVRVRGQTLHRQINEQRSPPIDGLFESLGMENLSAGEAIAVEISNAGTTGYVVVDAVQLLPVKSATN